VNGFQEGAGADAAGHSPSGKHTGAGEGANILGGTKAARLKALTLKLARGSEPLSTDGIDGIGGSGMVGK